MPAKMTGLPCQMMIESEESGARFGLACDLHRLKSFAVSLRRLQVRPARIAVTKWSDLPAKRRHLQKALAPYGI
jgi:hypothetical protein